MNPPATRPAALSLESLVGRLSAAGPRLVGEGAALVSAITEDSRQALPGTLFVARRGDQVDGTKYIPAAREAGATAILCAAGALVDVEPRIEVEDIRLAWGICAHELYGRPAEAMASVGITGTNGKTTVAFIVEQALHSLGLRVGRLGTLGFFLAGQRLEGSLTTPQPDQLARSFARVRDGGGNAMVMEVSSHALDQQRTAGVRFSCVAFTNLTQDHLDYHATMEAYGEAKAKLFRQGQPAARVLNIDDKFGRQLSTEFPDAITISASGATGSIFAVAADFGREGISAVVQSEAETHELNSPLLGRHNLENLLVAWGILRSLGHDHAAICAALNAATGVPGRMERCDGADDDVVVVVDYAHTPDALQRALGALSDLKFPEIVCVFGCGGDRDTSKRAPMGSAAACYADAIYLTSDNPRTEDPLAIMADVHPGLEKAKRPPIEEVDRRTAIELAIGSASPGAVVLIAGKGHEDYQLVGAQVLDFDDRVEARRALALRRERKGT